MLAPEAGDLEDPLAGAPSGTVCWPDEGTGLVLPPGPEDPVGGPELLEDAPVGGVLPGLVGGVLPTEVAWVVGGVLTGLVGGVLTGLVGGVLTGLVGGVLTGLVGGVLTGVLGGVDGVVATQPVCAGFVRPIPWLRSHS